MIENIRRHLRDSRYLTSFLTGLGLLFASLVVNFYAGQYAAKEVSNSVTDIVLSNIPVYDVDGIFIWGSIVFWIFVVLLGIMEPKRAPFILKSVALFIVIRSLFITLTHIGPFPNQLHIQSDVLSKFTFGGDLFFSGHTGLPFLIALLFWNHRVLRIVFTLIALLFGAVVLLGHLHYSIDVLSAFFITYSIYRIAERFFPEDKTVFHSGLDRPAE